ncbi:MAG: BatA domain-containing protein, partial [Vicinamibacterales bacterium]
MSFLAPLFLVALAGLAIPVFLHLIQRERKQVVQFPSLMFLRRIPYQSVQRRRIRHWLLLMMRLAALALIVLAFGRPFFRGADPAAAAAGGARELVILVDRSYSMGYGDRWTRAVAAARRAIDGMSAADRASIVFFGSGTDVALRSTSDKGRLQSALAAATLSSGATHFGPVLKLAGSILAESKLPRREVVLVSDFQRGGWRGADGVRLPDGTVLTPVAIGDAETANLAVTPVALERSTFSDQERVTVTAGVANHGPKKRDGVDVTLEIDGRAVQTQRVNVEPNASASATFAPVTVTGSEIRASVKLAEDAMTRDNTFHFMVEAGRPVRTIVLERPGGRDGSLY